MCFIIDTCKKIFFIYVLAFFNVGLFAVTVNRYSTWDIPQCAFEALHVRNNIVYMHEDTVVIFNTSTKTYTVLTFENTVLGYLPGKNMQCITVLLKDSDGCQEEKTVSLLDGNWCCNPSEYASGYSSLNFTPNREKTVQVSLFLNNGIIALDVRSNKMDKIMFPKDVFKFEYVSSYIIKVYFWDDTDTQITLCFDETRTKKMGGYISRQDIGKKVVSKFAGANVAFKVSPCENYVAVYVKDNSTLFILDKTVEHTLRKFQGAVSDLNFYVGKTTTCALFCFEKKCFLLDLNKNDVLAVTSCKKSMCNRYIAVVLENRRTFLFDTSLREIVENEFTQKYFSMLVQYASFYVIDSHPHLFLVLEDNSVVWLDVHKNREVPIKRLVTHGSYVGIITEGKRAVVLNRESTKKSNLSVLELLRERPVKNLQFFTHKTSNKCCCAIEFEDGSVSLVCVKTDKIVHASNWGLSPCQNFFAVLIYKILYVFNRELRTFFSMFDALPIQDGNAPKECIFIADVTGKSIFCVIKFVTGHLKVLDLVSMQILPIKNIFKSRTGNIVAFFCENNSVYLINLNDNMFVRCLKNVKKGTFYDPNFFSFETIDNSAKCIDLKKNELFDCPKQDQDEQEVVEEDDEPEPEPEEEYIPVKVSSKKRRKRKRVNDTVAKMRERRKRRKLNH